MLARTGGVFSSLAIGSGAATRVDAAATPAIIGHRGASGLAPPNTRDAIQTALEHDVDGVELDVRRTRDGEFVLFHDPVLDVSSTGSGIVCFTSSSEVLDATVGGEPILTLDEGLALLADRAVDAYLELKRPGYTRAVLDRVRQYGLSDRTTLASFDESALTPALRTPVETALVGTVPRDDLVTDARQLGAGLVSTHYTPHITDQFVSTGRASPLDVGVWALLESEDSIRDVVDAHPDVLITNRPDIATDVVAER